MKLVSQQPMMILCATGRLCLLPVHLILLFVCFYAFDLASCYVAQAGFEPTVSPGWPTSFCLGLRMMLSSVVCVAASPAAPGFRLCCVAAGLLVTYPAEASEALVPLEAAAWKHTAE